MDPRQSHIRAHHERLLLLGTCHFEKSPGGCPCRQRLKHRKCRWDIRLVSGKQMPGGSYQRDLPSRANDINDIARSNHFRPVFPRSSLSVYEEIEVKRPRLTVEMPDCIPPIEHTPPICRNPHHHILSGAVVKIAKR